MVRRSVQGLFVDYGVWPENIGTRFRKRMCKTDRTFEGTYYEQGSGRGCSI